MEKDCNLQPIEILMPFTIYKVYATYYLQLGNWNLVIDLVDKTMDGVGLGKCIWKTPFLTVLNLGKIWLSSKIPINEFCLI